jgi:hypothetical protein
MQSEGLRHPPPCCEPNGAAPDHKDSTSRERWIRNRQIIGEGNLGKRGNLLGWAKPSAELGKTDEEKGRN